MKKFICITQTNQINAIKGPSGNTYTSQQGEAFEVTKEEDIEFFSKFKNRYEEVTFFKKITGTKVPSAEEIQIDLEGYFKARNISEGEIAALVHAYDTFDTFKNMIEQDRRALGVSEETHNSLRLEITGEKKYPFELGNGYFEISNGDKVKGKIAAIKAEKKIGGK